MLKALVKSRTPQFWVIIHLLLGFSFVLARWMFVVWIIVFLFTSLTTLTQGPLAVRRINLIYVISYLSSWELMSRMTKAYSFGFPWEFGKYVILVFSLYGIVALTTRKGLKGFAMFFLMVPGMLFSPVFTIKWKHIVLNLLGPLALALLVVATTDLKILKVNFRQILLLILFPCLSVLAYTYIKTPDLDSIEFTLGSMGKTSGQFGANQVSTVLGLGFFLCFIFWINKWKLMNTRTLDIGLMSIFLFQALISFSRGGVIGAGVGIIAFLYIVTRADYKLKKKYKLPSVGKYVVPIVVGLGLVFTITDSITGGVLTLRYKGETTGTLLGKKELDINTLTTGRYDIMMFDLDLWSNYFILGTGVGSSSYLRPHLPGRDQGHNSHVELSRLLAEHGLLGMTYFLILLYMGYQLFFVRGNQKYSGILMAFYMIGLYTTFHAAMRTFMTPLLVGLSQLQILDIKDPEEE